MPWTKDEPFNVSADASGQILIEHTIQVPPFLNGKLVGYRIETTDGCNGRTHETTILIERVADQSDKIKVGPINIIDCKRVEENIDYEVKQLKSYKIRLESKGFQPNEQVKGIAALNYTLKL